MATQEGRVFLGRSAGSCVTRATKARLSGRCRLLERCWLKVLIWYPRVFAPRRRCRRERLPSVKPRFLPAKSCLSAQAATSRPGSHIALSRVTSPFARAESATRRSIRCKETRYGSQGNDKKNNNCSSPCQEGEGAGKDQGSGEARAYQLLGCLQGEVRG